MQKSIPIVTTRFNNETWQENMNYRINNKLDGCIYPVPQTISPKIDYNSLVFVVEMNNSSNCIEGIGLIRNKIQINRHNVYQDGNFNRYTYKSNYYLSREEIHTAIIEILDYILFKEKTHLKRGIGFTKVPEKLLQHKKCSNINLSEEIRTLFLRRFSVDK